MTAGKLTEILRTFSPAELNSFSKFISSKYFTGRNLSPLFKYIRKLHPDFPAEKMHSKTIYKNIFPDEKFNEKKILNLIFDLTKLTEEFLIITGLNKHKVDRQKYLALELQDRNCDKLFLKSIKSMEQLLQKSKGIDEGFLLDERMVNNLLSQYYGSKLDFVKSSQFKSRALGSIYLLFMILHFEALRDKFVLKNHYYFDYEVPFTDALNPTLDLENFINFLEEKSYKYSTAYLMKYLSYKVRTEQDNDINYYKLRGLVLENLDMFSSYMQFSILFELISYCEKNIHRSIEFRKDLLEFTKLQLDKKLHKVSQNEYYHVAAFRKVILNCMELKEYEWAESFIEKYSKELHPDYIKNARNLGYAYLFFSKGEFGKALEKISKVNYDFYLYKLDVRNLNLRIHYELGLFDGISSVLDAYRHYLNNSKEISQEGKEHHSNFLKYFNELVKCKISGSKSDFDFLRNKIYNDHCVEYKSWLIEKTLAKQR